MFSRPTVKDLLNHEFFQEDTGIKVDLCNKEEAVASDSGKVVLRYVAKDSNKEIDKWLRNLLHLRQTPINWNWKLNFCGIHICYNYFLSLRLRVVDAKKRKDKHKENEAIQFDFDINNDNPDKIAEGMVSVMLQNIFKEKILEIKVIVMDICLWTSNLLFIYLLGMWIRY